MRVVDENKEEKRKTHAQAIPSGSGSPPIPSPRQHRPQNGRRSCSPAESSQYRLFRRIEKSDSLDREASGVVGEESAHAEDLLEELERDFRVL
jgi:hypothetical protein